MDRPTSTTVISWLLIAIGALSIFGTFVISFLVNNPSTRVEVYKIPDAKAAMAPFESVGYVIYHVAISIAWVVSGALLLRGANWSRWLCVVVMIVGIAELVFIGRFSEDAVFAVIFSIVVVTLLFKPSANEYFESGR